MMTRLEPSENIIETVTGAQPVNTVDSTSPVESITPDAGRREEPKDGIALCLSGGGYRAMLFHAGALIRLNQWGLLPQLARVSSVSGGSITAGALACAWDKLSFDADGVSDQLDDRVISPLRQLAHRTLDAPNILMGGPLPGSVAEWVARSYDRHLFHDKTLQDLPADEDGPRFVFCATNVMTKALFRFSRPYVADWRIGKVFNPAIKVATAVAASSAFPPFLSPLTLDLDDFAVEPTEGADLHRAPFTLRAVLTDGGVYDNLGLETAWKNYKTVLVSDAGGTYDPDNDPKTDWLGHGQQVLGLVYDQVRVLRTRQTIDAFKKKERSGALWTIRTDLAGFEPFHVSYDRMRAMATVETRLRAMEDRVQEQLLNWGYAACDATMRTHYRNDLPPAEDLPYPDAGI